MKFNSHAAVIVALLFVSGSALAQLAGQPYIHDPSTVFQSDGKYYTFGTGGGGLISDDGYTWHAGAVRPGGGVAPDVIKIGDRYYVAYAVGGGGMSGFMTGRSTANLLTRTTAILAALFFVTSIALAIFASSQRAP